MTESTPIDQDLDRIRLLNTEQVARALGVTIWTIHNWLRLGTFPRPLRLSNSHANKWRIADIERWLERKARSPEKQTPLRGIAKTYAERHLPRKRIRLRDGQGDQPPAS